MTSAISSSAPHPLNPANDPIAAPGTTASASGAVPAQLPGRSYASATKTATQGPPTAAGASAHNAKSTDSAMNGANATAHGGSQPANNGLPNGTPAGHGDHGRKPSVVINASGASGYTPNGGPVAQNGSRPAINFGMMNAGGSPLPQQSTPYQSQTSSLPAPPQNPRVISPAHSPAPIPQPPTSGGRPPSSLQNTSNGMTFGSMGGEGDPMRQGQAPLGPGMPPLHERRQSSQSMHSDMSNPNMPNMNRGFVPPSGRGRGFPQQPPYGAMQSPGPNFRAMANQPRPAPQFQQGANSPYMRGRQSPAIVNAQPHMPPQPGMQFPGYGQHMPHQMYNQPHFDPNAGFYPPYGYPYGQQYPGQGPPASPRPYPSPFSHQAPGMQQQPPFAPADMSRSASQSSRPPSSIGQRQTPSLANQPPPSQAPGQNQPPAQQPQQSAFVKPKQSKAIKITDAQGNEISFGKPSPAASIQAQPHTPVIVSTPNAPTPPPRAPSNQHDRTESKSTKTAEETKNAFQEQVKRQVEEEKRKREEEDMAKAKPEQPESEPQTKAPGQPEQAAENQVKEATAEAEEAAAMAAHDEEGEKAAEAAEISVAKNEVDKKVEEEAEEAEEETEEERIEREIAEMEAAEKEEEERERAFQEKRTKEKEEAAKLEAERAAKEDEELKRQEREAEEREEARDREREAEKAAAAAAAAEEPDEEAKEMFSSLKRPTVGPGASQPESGAETPAIEEEPAEELAEEGEVAETPSDASAMPPPAQQPSSAAKPLGAPKQRPAQLKLETTKRVEPAEPTPGMQALKSARFLSLKEEPKYPDGFKSPNPALNLGASRKGRAYEKDFLLQFQSVFKEKPSVDWDQKVKETLGPSDEAGSARVQSAARTPYGMTRQPPGRPGPQAVPNFGGPMGQFAGQTSRTIPPGTTSDQRFMASMGAARPGMATPGPQGRMPSQLGMGAPGVGMIRNPSLQQTQPMGAPGSPRQASARGGKGGSRRGDRTMSRKEEADMAAKMPLTAHMELTPLEKSVTGWKPTSIGQPIAAGPDLSGVLAPDLVQRKVKAALNKMTPEKFDKISDQILDIAAQSKHESDGRTLRQVIQLTFEKACDEAHWAGMYAKFCHKMLTAMSQEIRDETIKDKNGAPVVGGALFRKYLLNRCQEEFERGWQVNLPEKPEGESQEAALLSDEYYIAAAAKRRGLGLIQFIGQLYKLRMLTLRIMHECVLRLLNFEGEPDEIAVENLTTLLRSVGSTMEEDNQGQQFMNAYFQRIDDVILKSDKLGSRPRFMIMDLLDLRRAGWRGKGDDSKGPKTLDQIHAEAAAQQARQEAERQRQGQRGGQGGRMPQGRGDSRNFSGGGVQAPVDYQRTMVGMDDLRRLQNRGSSQRQTGGGLGPGGSLGPGGGLGARAGSRRGGNLGPPSSGNTTRTNTPPVDNKEKKDEPSTQQNAFSALATLDPSGEAPEDAAEAGSSPPAARNRSKSPLAAEKADNA